MQVERNNEGVGSGFETIDFVFKKGADGDFGQTQFVIGDSQDHDDVYIAILSDTGVATMAFSKDEWQKIISNMYSHFIDGLEVLAEDFG